MKKLAILALGVGLCVACSSSSDVLSLPGVIDEPAGWVAGVESILTEAILDPTLDSIPAEPPYSQPVQYAAADITSMRYGVADGYLYMRADFRGPIPTAPVVMAADGEFEAQTVIAQSYSLVFDTDNNNLTGGGATQNGNGIEGVDIFFAFSLDYGGPPDVYANYDFANGDLHLNAGQVVGELGDGGPGYAYVISRIDISQLGTEFWPVGVQVEVGAWSEAESTLYHEFVNDWMANSAWTLPSND